MLDNIVDQVYDFNESILKVNDRSLAMLSQAEAEFAVKALREEAEEFEQAHTNGDFIGCVDASIDAAYFAIGNLKRLGLTREQAKKCITAVHNANMTKKKGLVAGRSDVSGVADAIKPEGWIPPEEAIANVLDGK